MGEGIKGENRRSVSKELKKLRTKEKNGQNVEILL